MLLACSSSKKTDKLKSEAKVYNHLFIFCNTADVGTRVKLEKDLSAVIAAKGYSVVKSTDFFPASLNDPRPPTQEQVTDSIAVTGCDALFVINFKRKEDVKYTPGVKVNENNAIITGLVAGGLGYRTDANSIKAINKPGSFAVENGFYIITDLVDAKTQKVVYSANSEIIEYAKLNTAGPEYLAFIVKQLETKKILKK